MERFDFEAFGVLLKRFKTELLRGFSAASGDGLVIVKAGAGMNPEAPLTALGAVLDIVLTI